MQILADNLAGVRSRIADACSRSGRRPEDVTLVAVTKTVSVEIARHLYELGIRDFAENRPQSLWEKQPQLPPDVRWHMIGHLQTNKLRRTLPLFSILHSLDRWSLATALDAELQRIGRRLPVAIEVNLTEEEAKHGFSRTEVIEIYPRLMQISAFDVQGLMTMARQEDDIQRCRPTFAALRELREDLVRQHPGGPKLAMLSMGMSGDFEVAIEEGATHIRVGSALFEGIGA